MEKKAQAQLAEAALAAPKACSEVFEATFGKLRGGGDELELPKEVRDTWRRLMHAGQLVEALTARDLHRLRTTAQNKPSARIALQAVATLLGVPDATGGPLRGMRTILGDLGSMVAAFQPQKVTGTQFSRLQQLVALPEFDESRVEEACEAAGPLAAWAKAAYELLEMTRFKGASVPAVGIADAAMPAVAAVGTCLKDVSAPASPRSPGAIAERTDSRPKCRDLRIPRI